MRRIFYYTAERALLVLVSVIVLFPIAWMFLTAFKQPRDAYSLSLNFEPTLQNFVTVFSAPWNLGSMVMNSVIVATVTVAIAVPCATLAAYSFSRFRVKGRKFLFFLILSTQFIPAVVIVLPFFLMFRQLDMLDTRLALIIVNLAIVTPFVIWMIKGFIDAIPTDSEEAAMIDGASRLRVIKDIVIPVAAPGIMTSSKEQDHGRSPSCRYREEIRGISCCSQAKPDNSRRRIPCPAGAIGLRQDHNDADDRGS